jgi:hypothetical protein
MEKSERFLVLIKTDTGNPKRFFVDNVVLEGNMDDLYKKMTDMDYMKSIGIPESLWFEEFELVKEDDVLFPDVGTDP